MYHGERFNGYTHLLGLMLATAGSALLIGKTASGGDLAKTASALVFAISMVTLYAASTLFHSTRGRTKLFWQRVDHCAIYLLIAGSYTPFALVTLQGAWGWALLGSTWLAALLGIARELRPAEVPKPSLWIYMGMGWLGALAAVPLVARLESPGLVWLLAGALAYSAGTVFYLNRSGWRHAHGMWHLFVLAGTASHYVTVSQFVL
ncbi:MAG: hemolysin III family protein [Gammaproteobacteria bacterium]|nr:hemolysin III family protein [Gammaproteobacteria bacterium]MBU1443085.1 hemolysin III family protein [Gammaproteobacteria bacterium]MBU2410391.1 hemolysin III family protein [Gammaproteobacteria bacterium]